MDCARKLLGQHQLVGKILFLCITNILIGLWIAFALSYLETKNRIDILEYQNQLFIDEITRIADSTKDPHQLIKDYALRRQCLMHLSAIEKIDKVITDLEYLKGVSKQNVYLDRSGRPDYALESAGAQILSTGNTKLATLPDWVSFSKFSMKIRKTIANGPNLAIQPSIYPGECFAFIGQGEITIKLIRAVFVDAVSVEHIVPQMSPSGNILSAPSNFSVYGMENGIHSNFLHLGDFRYEINKQQPLQLFRLRQNVSEKSFPIVRFVFVANHGDSSHTCVYRIRVHGSLSKPN